MKRKSSFFSILEIHLADGLFLKLILRVSLSLIIANSFTLWGSIVAGGGFGAFLNHHHRVVKPEPPVLNVFFIINWKDFFSLPAAHALYNLVADDESWNLLSFKCSNETLEKRPKVLCLRLYYLYLKGTKYLTLLFYIVIFLRSVSFSLPTASM